MVKTWYWGSSLYLKLVEVIEPITKVKSVIEYTESLKERQDF